MSDSKELAPTNMVIDSAAILEVAKDPNVDAEKAERLFALAKEMRAEWAAQQFSAAMNLVQAEIEPVRKLGRNPQTNSQFAKIEQVDEALTPVYLAHGFTVSASCADCPIADHMRVVLEVRHKDGHVKEYFLDAPVDDKGPKGAPVKTRLHGAGSTLTYVIRRLKCVAFNIQFAADDDGNKGGGGPGAVGISKDQALTLDALIDDVGADGDKFLQYFGIEALEDLPVRRYREATRMLEGKRK